MTKNIQHIFSKKIIKRIRFNNIESISFVVCKKCTDEKRVIFLYSDLNGGSSKHLLKHGRKFHGMTRKDGIGELK